jgi:hypothetical protein
MLRKMILPVFALVLVACSGDSTTGDSGATSTDSGTTASSDSGTINASADANWYRDVSPILQTHCTRCHYEDGLGTGDFNDFDTAKAMSEVMLSQIDAGLMPPPTSDPDCRDYVGSESMHLPEEARQTLQAWVEGGTPKGDIADAIVVDGLSEILENPDVEIYMTDAYTPTFSDTSQPGNEYRCFVIQDVPAEDYYITSLQPIIDTREIAHHVVLYSIREGSLSSAYTKPEGFDCIDGQEYAVIDDFVAGWAPGALPIELPDGVAMKMKGGAAFLLQMHYFDPGNLPEGTADRSGYAFKTTTEPETLAYFDVFGVIFFNIPAGDDSYTKGSSSSVSLNSDLTIYSLWPHMHVLGSGFEMTATNRSGEETCLVEGDYNFNNQVPYYFKEPFVVSGGSTLDYSCTWNNSPSNPGLIHDPPQATGYGERTDEEMCFFFALVSN